MVGVDTHTRQRVDGDADLKIDDFVRPEVDVAFIEIEDPRRHARGDIGWQDIPVLRGVFQARDGARSIKGRFYSSGRYMVGAFGASR